MNRICTRAGLTAFIVMSACMAAFAATPDSRPYVSPEIHPDHTVTFRVLAPHASEVTLEGGWMALKQTVPLVKDSKGLWSVTVGPLSPTVYAYWFNFDGAVVLDEANPFVRIRGGASSVSAVDVPDPKPLPWSVQDLPHGTVEATWQESKTFGDTRQVWVYLPPGYHANTMERYPVLYLFHGGGEHYFSWIESGKANLILDNLLAEHMVKPMIVVMPDTGPAADRPAAAPAAGGPNIQERMKAGDYIVNEVMPWAESTYRVLPGRKNRAIAGFSAGGALTASLGFTHLDLFSQMGIFSAPTQAFTFRYADVAKDPKGTNAKLNLLWIAVGRSDALEPASRKFDGELTQDGIRHTYMETDGAHDYAVWRWCLVQFAPLLFRGGA
jgi:enterochelin esterase-like enzyme